MTFFHSFSQYAVGKMQKKLGNWTKKNLVHFPFLHGNAQMVNWVHSYLALTIISRLDLIFVKDFPILTEIHDHQHPVVW